MKDYPSGTVKSGAIRPPKVPTRELLLTILQDQIVDEAVLESVLVEGLELTGRVAADVQISGATIINGTATGAGFEGLRLTDVRFADADWSNTNLFRTGWTRVSATGSKFVGSRLNEASLRDISFEDCIGDLLQAQMTTFERVRFVRCRLQGAMFNQSDLSHTVFDGCDLREADFTQTVLSGADVRKSELEGIRLGPDQLPDLIVTPDQALYLAGAIGLRIEA